MADKVNATDGWYDGKLVSASTNVLENGSLVLDLEFDIGSEYFWVKEGVFIRNAPSGDADTDAKRNEWTRDAVERIKEVYPEAVNGNHLILTKLTLADADISDKVVRVKVTHNGNYARAKVFAPRAKKQKVNRDEAVSAAIKFSRDLAKFGIVVDEPAAMSPMAVIAGSAEADDSDVPF